jgi:hypothetical protein
VYGWVVPTPEPAPTPVLPFVSEPAGPSLTLRQAAPLLDYLDSWPLTSIISVRRITTDDLLAIARVGDRVTTVEGGSISAGLVRGKTPSGLIVNPPTPGGVEPACFAPRDVRLNMDALARL